MKHKEYNKAELYSRSEISGTGYLGFRDIPDLIKKYVKGPCALDFGCGTGRSTRFLKNLGLTVDAVDNSQAMIKKASLVDKPGSYTLIQNNKIPQKSEYYNVVFSSFVLFEISTKKELIEIFTEIHRVLKLGGVFIAVTGSTEMYKHPWLSLEVDFEENKNLTSGKLARIVLKDIGLELYDYFWTDEDYKEIMQHTNFSLSERIYPLGRSDDLYIWKSETTVSPYVIYVMSKA